MNVELIERFIDYLIEPNQCIDSYGRPYIDDLENIVVENHEFNFITQNFPNKEAQDWFERMRVQELGRDHSLRPETSRRSGHRQYSSSQYVSDRDSIRGGAHLPSDPRAFPKAEAGNPLSRPQ